MSEDEILVDGRVTDDQYMGITKFAGKNTYVSLCDKELKPIPSISAKRYKTDASGYFTIKISKEDIKTLIEKKIEPKLLVECRKRRVMKEFVTPPLPKISEIPLVRRITINLSFTSTEIERQKAKKAEETKLRDAELRKRELEVMRERELEEKRKREEAERLKFEEEARKKLMEEIVREREAEKKRFEKETLEKLEAEMEEKMRAKRLEIEEETRKKTEAERKKGIPKLEEISGIGVKRAEKLREKGIADVEDFYKTLAGKLGEILGISKSRVRKMKEDNVSLLSKAP